MTTHLVLVTEDQLSEAVLQRLVFSSNKNFEIFRSIVSRGFGQIKRNVEKYRTACKAVPHIILTDLDQHRCPIDLLNSWGATQLPRELLLRVAVRQVESWLLADPEGLADFLGTHVNKFPMNPDHEQNAKQTLVNIARRSKSRISKEIVPESGSELSIGPLYNPHLTRFVLEKWNIESAATKSPSLRRTSERLSRFLQRPI